MRVRAKFFFFRPALADCLLICLSYPSVSLDHLNGQWRRTGWNNNIQHRPRLCVLQQQKLRTILESIISEKSALKITYLYLRLNDLSATPCTHILSLIVLYCQLRDSFFDRRPGWCLILVVVVAFNLFWTWLRRQSLSLSLSLFFSLSLSLSLSLANVCFLHISTYQMAFHASWLTFSMCNTRLFCTYVSTCAFFGLGFI